jgi:hypothetical protein
MSERIKELMQQAGTDTSGKWMGVDHAEKFAELIVRKCIKDCRDMFVVDSVSWNLLNEKLEHFGVEE